MSHVALTRSDLPATGPYVEVAVGAFSDRFAAEHLITVPLHTHASNSDAHEASARLVASLRVALPELKTYYETIRADESKRQQRAEFPFRNFIHDTDGRRTDLMYMSRCDDTRRLFRAHLQDDSKTPVFVKFTRRYSQAAHAAAHELGFAPKIVAVNDVYDWTMVVMEDLSASYVTAEDYDGIKLDFDLEKELMSALTKLHARNFVHGDIRDVNVMVKKNGESKSPIMIVDWDWAGTVGSTKYPHDLNPEGDEGGGCCPWAVRYCRNTIMYMVNFVNVWVN